MIPFGQYYTFSADQVESIESLTEGENAYPYLLKINFKTGKFLAIRYTNEQSRDNERRTLISRIEHELRNDYEKLYNKLYLIEANVSKIDKRQLRIWRQLERLLNGIEVEKDG